MEFHAQLLNAKIEQYFSAQDSQSRNVQRVGILNEIVEQFAGLVEEYQTRRFHVVGVDAKGELPRDPYISIFPNGESESKGICLAFGFKDDEEVCYVGCRVADPAKFINWQHFRESTRIASPEERQDIQSSRVGQDEHLAFPVTVFRRGEQIEKHRLTDALERALGVYDEVMKENTVNEPVLMHTDDGVIRINDALLNSFASRVKSLESDIQKFEALQRDMQAKSGAGAHEIERLRDNLNTLGQLVKDVQSKADEGIDKAVKAAQDKADDFIQQKTGEITRALDELNKLKSLSTVGCLAKKFEEKQKLEEESLKQRSNAYYACLSAFVVLGVVAVCLGSSLVDETLQRQFGRLAYFVVLPKTLARLSPLYIPLLWITCHFWRLVAQTRRLMEEYAHKAVVANTYSGLAAEIDSMAQKRVEIATELRAELMRTTIKVFGMDPNDSLDKVKHITPLSEATDCATKLITAAKDLKVATING